MSYVIELEGLSRVYESYIKPEGLMNSVRGVFRRQYQNKTALHPTDLVIPAGQIVGLVGANGAGKTTLLKLLSGLIHPTAGTAKVLGFEPSKREAAMLQQLSLLLGQKNQLWWDLAPLDSFGLLAEIYDLPRASTLDRARYIAGVLDCQHVLQTQLRRLSLGERMKMELIGCLLHEPKLLFLDEPTIGLDVLAQTTIRDFIANEIKGSQKTVILTSHYMDDIARLADRLILMSQGRIVYDGTVQGFVRQTTPTQQLIVRFSKPLSSDINLTGDLTILAGSSEWQVSLPKDQLPGVLAEVSRTTPVHDLTIQEANFEDIIRAFLQKESGVRATGTHSKS